MKITKRQLKRLIKEEKAKLQTEGQMAQKEMQIVDEIVDLLIDRGAVRRGGLGSYMEAYEYLATAILPTLKSLL